MVCHFGEVVGPKSINSLGYSTVDGCPLLLGEVLEGVCVVSVVGGETILHC